jgi:hypothetical protein
MSHAVLPIVASPRSEMHTALGHRSLSIVRPRLARASTAQRQLAETCAGDSGNVQRDRQSYCFAEHHDAGSGCHSWCEPTSNGVGDSQIATLVGLHERYDIQQVHELRDRKPCPCPGRQRRKKCGGRNSDRTETIQQSASRYFVLSGLQDRTDDGVGEVRQQD